jgi:hypothetical protein
VAEPVEELHDPIAERYLLTAALQGQLDAFLAVPADAFTNWLYADIASAIRSVVARKLPVELPTVGRTLVAAASGGTRGQELHRVMVEVFMAPPVSGGGAYYAERISDLKATRDLNYAVNTFGIKSTYAVKNDDPAIMKDAITNVRAAIDQAENAFLPNAVPDLPMSVAELLGKEEEDYNWLVPGLLERMDRLILTGFEGLGKSYLLAQLALCVGAGIHPFTQDPLPMKPYRALVIDCENSERQVNRRYKRIVSQIADIYQRNDMGAVNWDECVRLELRPDGLDLTDPGELARITQLIESTAPDLVVAGPLYKMSRLNIQEEQAAQELTLTLDGLRAKFGFALICEAHAGHASDSGGSRKVRPIGSSLFLRWPEFGFGIAPLPEAEAEDHPSQVQVRHWRGARDERDWPKALHHGSFLPWEVSDPGYYEQVRARVW